MPAKAAAFRFTPIHPASPRLTLDPESFSRSFRTILGAPDLDFEIGESTNLFARNLF